MIGCGDLWLAIAKGWRYNKLDKLSNVRVSVFYGGINEPITQNERKEKYTKIQEGFIYFFRRT